MYSLLYNAKNHSKRRFLFNILEMDFDLTIMSDAYNRTAEYLNKFDLIINDRHLSRLSSYTALNHINPKKIVNGSLNSSQKTFVGEMYEKHFGNKLNIYFGEDYKGKIFAKREWQTYGEYKRVDEPIWEKGWVNQIDYWNETGIYGLYFFMGELIYSYNYRNKDDFFVKLKNVKEVSYFDVSKTQRLFKKDKEKLLGIAKDCGMDYGRLDLIKDPKVGWVVIDANNAPFGNQVFDREFIKTGIHQEASKIIKNLIINKIEQNKKLLN